MNFFKNIFSRSKSKEPQVVFGRNFEIVKTRDQLNHWDQAMLDFEAERYIDSIEHFIHYLNQPELDLIHIERGPDAIQFTLIQGSKIISAQADNSWFRAKVDIIQAENISIGLYRKMLESSYKLTYGRYASFDNHVISILFDGYLQEASPYKLLNGLKEMSLRADKEDDLILDEFDHVERINSSHIKELGQQEKAIKYEFFKKCLDISLSEEQYKTFNKSKTPGGVIYVIFSFLYKIDYLLRPEGKLLNEIEKAHKKYFEKNDEDLNSKLNELEKFVKTLNNFNEETLSKELYLVYHCFPVTNGISTVDLSQHIEIELQALQWYFDNQHFKICEDIITYIVASSFFNYTLPTVTHRLMHIYFELTETDFFRKLGYHVSYDLDNNLEKTAKELVENCKKVIGNMLGKEILDKTVFKLDPSTRISLLISFIRFIQNFHYS
ncbi:MAG: hypothetical protein ABIO44_05500 [Saprospiraceae bacterium]